MKLKKISALLSLAILATFIFTGCSSEPDYGLSITAIAPTVSYEKAEEYAATITVGEESLPIRITTEMMISPVETENKSPESYEENVESTNQKSAEMMGAAGLMKITAQISSKEIDIIISDYENGQRFSSMEAFMPLEEVFTAEELAELDESLFVSYEDVDNDNNPTGDMLPSAGIDVSSVEVFQEFMVADQLVCHVVGNTENLEVAKEYLLSLIS